MTATIPRPEVGRVGFLRRRLITVTLIAGCAAALLAGCATGPRDADGAASAGPSCAVPAQEGVAPPSGCTAYDPEAGMVANDSYRERLDIGAASQSTGDGLAAAVRDALAQQQASGTAPTAQSVTDALVSAGLAVDGVQVREDGGAVLFGATFAAPGDTTAACVYGSAAVDAVDVEVGGLIRDGGCLPAQ